MGLFGFFSKKDKSNKNEQVDKNQIVTEHVTAAVPYDEQIEIFKSLGYQYDSEVTKEMILRDVYEMSWEDEAEKFIENNPYSILYYTFGWRDPSIKNYNYTNKCLWFDLEFFDPNIQYKWFMERLGSITDGEIRFTEIRIEKDSENWEWISFKVNGIYKKWKLEKTGYIADHFVQRFSYLPTELNTKGKYTYYDNGGQQWVIDYATEEEQIEFNNKTGLNRKWLGLNNQFSNPPTTMKYHNHNLNIWYQLPKEIWDKMPAIYEQSKGFLGYRNGTPYWYSYNESEKFIVAGSEPSGLLLHSLMDEEEWEIWLRKFKDLATKELGFKVGEIELGEVGRELEYTNKKYTDNK